MLFDLMSQLQIEFSIVWPCNGRFE